MITIGQTVKFTTTRTDLCRPHLQNGALCKILEIKPNTAIVRFDGQTETDIVSLAYLEEK